MGYDIELCLLEYYPSKKKYKIVEELDNGYMYLSYNFSKYKRIDFNDKKIKLWYIWDDCNGRKGKDIEKRALKALNKLKLLGIDFKNINEKYKDNNNWGWACGLESYEDELRVFAYHINRIKLKAQEYPNYYFLIDYEVDDNFEKYVDPQDIKI